MHGVPYIFQNNMFLRLNNRYINMVCPWLSRVLSDAVARFIMRSYIICNN